MVRVSGSSKGSGEDPYLPEYVIHGDQSSGGGSGATSPGESQEVGDLADSFSRMVTAVKFFRMEAQEMQAGSNERGDE
jgi:hypothetical protein